MSIGVSKMVIGARWAFFALAAECAFFIAIKLIDVLLGLAMIIMGKV